MTMRNCSQAKIIKTFNYTLLFFTSVRTRAGFSPGSSHLDALQGLTASLRQVTIKKAHLKANGLKQEKTIYSNKRWVLDVMTISWFVTALLTTFS